MDRRLNPRSRRLIPKSRRLAVALGGTGILVATATATLATSAAFSTSADSSPASAIAGLATVPELSVSTRVSTTGNTASDSTISMKADVDSRSYDARGAGVVVVRVTKRDVTVIEVQANEGWTSATPEHQVRNGVPQIEVDFTSKTESVEFVALLLNGKIITRVDSEARSDQDATDSDDGTYGDHGSNPAGTTGSTTPGSTPTTVDDGSGGGGGGGGGGGDDNQQDPDDPDDPDHDEREGPEPTEAREHEPPEPPESKS